MIALLAAVAFAQDPACERMDPPPATLAVAWVSPVRQAVGAGAWLPVVAAADLRAFVAKSDPSQGRLLQALGAQKKDKPPHRRYKVTIFEVRADLMCRPVEGADEGFVVDGLPSCGHHDRATSGNSGCGYTTDRKDDSRGFDLYRVPWRDAAARGFCVLPLDRYLEDASKS